MDECKALISGLALNSLGIVWYAWERYADERRRKNVRQGITGLNETFMTRNESQAGAYTRPLFCST